MDKRLKIVAAFLAVVLAVLGGRLAYIQIFQHDELAEIAKGQSMITLNGSNSRGIIYDRNGVPLVADCKSFVYIIKKDDFDRVTARLLREMGAEQIVNDDETYYVYTSDNYDKEAGKRLIDDCDAYILQASARYGEDQVAEHLIGYVNSSDSSGAAGLELMYEDKLSGLDRKVYAAADVNGDILRGRGLVITSEAENDSYISEGIRTTLDKDIQKKAEEAIETVDNDCCAVVLDVATGGVVAMACTPGFDPNKAVEYIEGGGDELVNKATQGEFAPGSLFKIVVAAAALESGMMPDYTCNCSGSVQLSEVSIKCETGGETGHGSIDFSEAFAESCNCFFIEIGKQIGADKIIETAERMGLGKTILEGYPHESAGHLMSSEERAADAIGNLCIGQGETLVTPLQMAAMTLVIASGGVYKDVHLLMEDEPQGQQVISSHTAEIIGEMMECVTSEGTASSLEMKDASGYPKAAVKTGTAEYGAKEDGTSHGWISGYAPCEAPEYVITVLVEGGGSGSSSAGPIFKEILDYLDESGSYARPTFT